MSSSGRLDLKTQTHCPQGHPYDYIAPNGWRKCRECGRTSHKLAYIQNPEKVLNRIHQRRLKYPELARAAELKWRTANPEKSCDIRGTRRARKLDAFVEMVNRQIVFERDAGICGECNTPVIPDNWHLDHVIPLAKGGKHSYENVQVTHPMCNYKKGSKLPEEKRIAA